MFKEIAVTTILSLCFYFLKSDDACKTFVDFEHRLFVDRMKTINWMMQRDRNQSRFCKYVTGRWGSVRIRAMKLMCLNYYISSIKMKHAITKAKELCKDYSIDDTGMYKCGLADKFQNCIDNTNLVALTAAADLDSNGFNACNLCNASSSLVKCACKGQLHRKCPMVFTTMFHNPFLINQCRICGRGIRKPPECCRGYYGSDCNMKCNCVGNTRCSNDGTCRGACHHRYYGYKGRCQKTCKPGLYLKGDRCEGKCLCKNIDQCVVTNGRCVDGQCIAGYVAKNGDCTRHTECSKGKFNVSCLLTCRCRDNAECNKKTGKCPNGCHHRYYGTYCQKECKSGYYVKGNVCKGKCLCKHVDQCAVSDGRCLDGQCKVGYAAKYRVCRPCSEGTFGTNCSQSCHCADNATCDSKTGKCPNGCHHRYYGWFCLKTCPDGWYLKSQGICNGKCLCTNINQCLVTSGECEDSQCIDGYIAVFKTCFVDVKNETIPVFLDNEIVRTIPPQAVILLLIGFAVIVAALFAIFSGIYSRCSVSKMEQGVEPVTDVETPSKSPSRLANSRTGSMDKRRDSDESSTASLSPRGRKRSKRSQRKRKNKSPK